MKSNVNRGSLTPRFPTLAIHPRTEMVVLFTSESEGTVVHPGESGYELGCFSNNWNPCRTEYWNILPRGSTVTFEV